MNPLLPVSVAVAMLTVLAEVRGQELRRISPPLLSGGCYDPLRQRVVIPVLEGYSREWDGSVWRQTPDRGSPSGFTYFDDAAGRLVSLRAGDPFGFGPAFFVSTRSGHEWQPVPVSGGPTNRMGMALAWDRGRAEVLAFGGWNLNNTPLGDTWTFDGTAWAQLTPAQSPSPRDSACVAYDSARQCVVLFGGFDLAARNDTWEWNGTTWTPVAVPVPPPATAYTPMAYDAARARTVLVVGNASGTAEHWEYDGAGWTQLTPPPFPPPLGLVFDAARSETLAFGSSDASAYRAIVHAWNGTTWAPRGDLGTVPYEGNAFAAATGPSGATLRRFSGMGFAPSTVVDSLWEFDGATWTQLASGGLPGRAPAAMWSMPGATFVFGGRDATNTLLGDTWRWNGTAWAQLGSGPSPRQHTAVAFDPVQNVAVLFGGDNGFLLADTWTFDGTTWQQVTPPGPQPPARHSHAMAYDVARNRVVLFGGLGPLGPFGNVIRRDTWEWNGSSWQQVFTVNAPWSTGTMAWDAVRQRIVFATRPTSAAVYELWDYDGTNWSTLSATGAAGSPHALTALQPIAVTGPSGRVAIVDIHGVAELLPVPARAEHYGATCGTGSLLVTAAALPRVPEPAFALDVTGAPATAPVLLAGSTDSAAVPLFGCTLLVVPQTTLLLLSSAQGFASQPLPIPATASLLGEDFYFQAAVLGGAGLVLSTGLRIDLGQ